MQNALCTQILHSFLSFVRSFICLFFEESNMPIDLLFLLSKVIEHPLFSIQHELNIWIKSAKYNTAIPYYYYKSHRQAEIMWQNNNLSIITKTAKQKARKQTKWIPCTPLTFKRESMPFIIIMIIIIKLKIVLYMHTSFKFRVCVFLVGFLMATQWPHI